MDSAGNLFIADSLNDRVRKVDGVTGIITTVAGNGLVGAGGDGGPATAAQLDSPNGVAVDAAGNLFIADTSNLRIRKVNGATGVITTLAGNGSSGFSGDGGAAAGAQFGGPTGVAVDNAGNLFIADLGNFRIRTVEAGSFRLDDASPDDGDGVSQSVTFSNLLAGAVAVTEIVPAKWVVENAKCDGSDAGSLSNATLTVSIAAGEVVTCAFFNGSNPLAVTLGWFLAQRNAEAVDIRWQTATETGTAGFNVLAVTEGGKVRLNNALIPSAVIDSVAPINYAFSAVTDAGRFYLEEVSVDGGVTEHGPFDVGQEYGSYAVPDNLEVSPMVWLPMILHDAVAPVANAAATTDPTAGQLPGASADAEPVLFLPIVAR